MKMRLFFLAVFAAISTSLFAEVSWSSEDFSAINAAIAAATPTNTTTTAASRKSAADKIVALRDALKSAQASGDAEAIRVANTALTENFLALLDAGKTDATAKRDALAASCQKMEEILIGKGIVTQKSAVPTVSQRRQIRAHDALFSSDGLGALGLTKADRALAASLARAAGRQRQLGVGNKNLLIDLALKRARIAELDGKIRRYDRIKAQLLGAGIDVALDTLLGTIDESGDPIVDAAVDYLGEGSKAESAQEAIAPIGDVSDNSLFY